MQAAGAVPRSADGGRATLKSLVGFIRDYARIGLDYESARGRLASDTVAGQLVRDGIVVIPHYKTSAEVEHLLNGVPPTSAMRLSPEGTRNHFVDDADRIPDLLGFFDDPFIEEVMRTVIGKRAYRLRCVAQRNEYLGWTGSFEQFFHSDTWRHRLKAFLYLVDVTEQNGPLEYAPRTQRGSWRWLDDWHTARAAQTAPDTYSHSMEAQYAGVILPHRMPGILRWTRSTPRLVTGGAGTLIIFDGRGLHRATPLRQGWRINLSSYWIEAGAHT